MKWICVISMLTLVLLTGCVQVEVLSDGPEVWTPAHFKVATFNLPGETVRVAAHIEEQMPEIVPSLPDKAENEQYVLVFSSFSPALKYKDKVYQCQGDIATSKGNAHLLILPSSFDPTKGIDLGTQIPADSEITSGTI